MTTGLGKDFWWYRSGQLLSALGNGFGFIAISLWLFQKTGSAAAAGTVVSVSLTVRLILLPLLGPVGDKLPRKNILALADLARMFTWGVLALCTLGGTVSRSTVVTIHALSAAAGALFGSCSEAIVPQLVRPEALGEAMARSETLNAVVTVVGGLLAGLATTQLGFGFMFAFNALSFLLAGLATLQIRVSTRAANGGRAMNLKDFSYDLKAGIHSFAGSPLLTGFALVFALMQLASSPVDILLPTLIRDVHGQKADILGYLLAANGIGAMGGGLLLTTLGSRIPKVAAPILTFVTLGILMIALPALDSPFKLLPALAAFSCVRVLGLVPLQTQLDLVIPDDRRSRVHTLLDFISGCTAPVGIFASSHLAQQWGVPALYVTGGWIIVALGIMLGLVPGYTALMRGLLASPWDIPRRKAGFLEKLFARAVTPAQSEEKQWRNLESFTGKQAGA